MLKIKISYEQEQELNSIVDTMQEKNYKMQIKKARQQGRYKRAYIKIQILK